MGGGIFLVGLPRVAVSLCGVCTGTSFLGRDILNDLRVAGLSQVGPLRMGTVLGGLSQGIGLLRVAVSLCRLCQGLRVTYG